MKIIFIVSALVYGASSSFYSQNEVLYLVCLLLIFIAGHYAGFKSSSSPTLIITSESGEAKCSHEDEANILRNDLIWLFGELDRKGQYTAEENVQVILKLREIRKRIGVIK